MAETTRRAKRTNEVECVFFLSLFLSLSRVGVVAGDVVV